MAQNKLGLELSLSLVSLSLLYSALFLWYVPMHENIVCFWGFNIVPSASKCGKDGLPQFAPSRPSLDHLVIARRSGPGKATALGLAWVRRCHLAKEPGNKLGRSAHHGSLQGPCRE